MLFLYANMLNCKQELHRDNGMCGIITLLYELCWEGIEKANACEKCWSGVRPSSSSLVESQ